MQKASKNDRTPTSMAGNRRPSTAGFSLLEVLISLVVLSVGLLGMAGLMSTTLKTNDSAYMRTQATVEAYNIMDRMRSNTSAVSGGNYAIAMPATPVAGGSLPNTCTGNSAACTAPQLATYDLAQWEYELAQRLPDGRGSITTTPISNGLGTDVVVTVLWNDSRASRALNGPPSATTFSLAVHSVL